MRYVAKHTRRYWYIYSSLLVVLFSGAIIAYLFRNQINPDGVSYFQVAHYYASFEFSKAINGYWSPLLSWLLIPFSWIGLELGYGYRLLTLALSLTVVAALHLLLERRAPSLVRQEQWGRALYLSTLGVLINLWGSSVVTPDMLSGIVCVVVILTTHHYVMRPTINRAILAGSSMALLYFSRSIGFYLAAILILFCFAYLMRKQRLNRSFYWFAGIFVALSCLWIGLLFFKYDHLGISTAGAYNTALYGPELPTHPHASTGFLDTPYSDSVWGWDDPSSFVLPKWNKLDHLQYFTFHFIDTASQAITMLFATSPLVALAVYANLMGRKSMEELQVSIFTILVVALVVLAYSYVLYIEPRYLWLATIPLLASVCIGSSSLMRTRAFAILSGIIFVSTVLNVLLLYQKSETIRYEEAAIKVLSMRSTDIIPQGSTIVGSYPFHYQYCYYSSTRCVGNFELSGDLAIDQTTIQNMRKNGVDYYVDFTLKNIDYLPVVYRNQSTPEKCFNAVAVGNQPCDQLGVRIYRVK